MKGRSHARIQAVLSKMKKRPKIRHKTVMLSALQMFLLASKRRFFGLKPLIVSDFDFVVLCVCAFSPPLLSFLLWQPCPLGLPSIQNGSKRSSWHKLKQVTCLENYSNWRF